MPRPGWRKPESDRRLSDAVSVGVLTKVFPPEVVDEVIATCGRTEQRRRSLPARAVAYFAMGMALHSDGSYEDVLALVTDGLAWSEREEGPVRLANKAAISHARDRLGPEPMAALFETVAKPRAPGARRKNHGGLLRANVLRPHDLVGLLHVPNNRMSVIDSGLLFEIGAVLMLAGKVSRLLQRI